MKAVAGAAAAARARLAAIVMAALVAACGGGGSSSPAPTELPESLSLTTSTTRTALGASVTPSSNVSDPSNGLTYAWSFGDGTTSTQASPNHSYAKAGVYTIELTVTNEAGKTRNASTTIYVSDMDLVKGRSCSGDDSTGWCWQRPLPQGNQIADYHFVSDTQGWAVGELGTILVTSDGGVTWTAQASGTDQPLTRVVFTDAQSGWITSTNGQLLRTVDGGAHWQALSVGPADVSAFGASSAERAWVSGSYYAAPRTTEDGGAHWTSITAPSGTAQSYSVVSTSVIWAAVYGSSGIALVSTRDGGTTWSTATLPAPEAGLSRSLYSMSFIDADHGWVLLSEYGYQTSTSTYVSRTVPLRTSDGGATWQSFTNSASYYYYGFQLSFIDANNGFAWSPYGAVQRTIDAGSTWQPVSMPSTGNVYTYYTQFRAFSAQRLLLKDSTGRAYLSTDGGATWLDRSANGTAGAALNSIWFFDAREGVAFGNDGSSVRTSDGGQTWTASTSNTSYYGWRRPQFSADGSVGWILSDTGTVYRSTDKGKSWLAPVPQTSASLPYATDFHFVDAQQGWAVTPYAYSSAAVYRTTDGGSSWQAVSGTGSYGGLASVRFADALHGVAVGPAGYALVTSDGGTSWDPRPTGTDRQLRRVTFLDAETAVAVGDDGVILRSTDRGLTWTKTGRFGSTTLHDVRFVSALTGFAVGEFGAVFVSRDGGLSWDRQKSGAAAALYGVFAMDGQTAWIVGANGTVLVTATGGE